MTSQFSAYVITEPCVGVKDETCLEVCPVDCIASTYEDDQYFVDPEILVVLSTDLPMAPDGRLIAA